MFREELQSVFDEMIDKMFRLIDENIRTFVTTYPGETIVSAVGNSTSSQE